MKQAAKSWRAKKKGGKAKSSSRKGGKRTTMVVARGKKILGNYGASGLLEDAAIGYFGSQIFLAMGYPLESAMPMTRVIQGIAGKALDRRGKGRLAYGLIDLLDVYLIKQGVRLTQGVSLKAWM